MKISTSTKEKQLNREEEILTEAFNAYMDAINSHDFSEVSKLLHKNAVFYIDNQVQTELKQIEAHHNRFWDTLKDSKFWATDIKILHRDYKSCIYTYQYNFSGYINGEYVEGIGRSTDVFVQNDITNQWELLHEHSSGD